MTFPQIISNVYAWVMAHTTTSVFGAYYIISAFVGSLQMPDNTTGWFYRFFFKFVNALAANFSRAAASSTAAGYQPPKSNLPPGAVPVGEAPPYPLAPGK
jgi:hypothetical protein